MNTTGKKVLLVTTANMTCNPRCYKELTALVNSGYKVSVLKFDIRNWSEEYEALLESALPQVQWITLDTGRRSKAGWLAATLVGKLAGKLQQLFPKNLAITSYAIEKRSWLLHNKLKQIASQYDLLIAHNLGAFLPVYNAAKDAGIPYGVDVEDYHPGEYDDTTHEQYARMLMQGTLKDAAYVTAAAPLILQHTIQDVPAIKERSVVVNNVFLLELQPEFQDLPLIDGEPLKLVWFSQNVGLDRGLDDVIGALNQINDFPIELTLIGNCTDSNRQFFTDMLTNTKHALIFKKPLPEKELMIELSQYHIGLALEIVHNLNKRICIANKMSTYLLCGNAIIASGTEGQELFMKQYPGIGQTYTSGNPTLLATAITKYYNDKQLLQQHRRNGYKLATEELNWEKEQQLFLAAVNKALS